MTKLDHKKQLKQLYYPSAKEVGIVDVPTMQFIMADGVGNPNTAQAFKDAIEALYSVSYAIKFSIKKKGGDDYTVMPLEGMWWAEDMSSFDTNRDKDTWLWTLMIMQPEPVTVSDFLEAMAHVKRKKNPVGLGRLRWESYHEGPAAQIMHIGSFDSEGPTIDQLHAHIDNMEARCSGKHHEIYLSDLRRTASEKLKTVIRQPYA